MVVDDNPTKGRLLLDQCRLWNVEACVFEKPAEARDVLQADPTKWDLVLVDYEMPGMNGLAFAKSLAGLVIPPLVLLGSAFDMPSSVDRNLFADVLHEPVRPDVFRGLLKKWLSGSREKRPPRPAPAAGRRSKIRILVAEDNATNRKVVRSMLGVLGHSAVVVENGRQAVAAAGAESFHLILLDVQMPEVDGLEAARQIRAFPPGEVGRPWIVALTANAFKEDREACLAAGMDDYLAKPVKLDDLRRLLKTVSQTLSPETSEKR